jgi:hypothetical protein
MKRIRCQACDEKTGSTTPWHVRFSVAVTDPDTGMVQGLHWAELLECCDFCVEEHPNGAEPYRGRFWRPHLMKVYNRDRQACGFSEVVPA